MITGTLNKVMFTPEGNNEYAYTGLLTSGLTTPDYYNNAEIVYYPQPYGTMCVPHEGTTVICDTYNTTYNVLGTLDTREIIKDKCSDLEPGEQALFSDTYALILENIGIVAKWAENNKATLVSGEDVQNAISVICTALQQTVQTLVEFSSLYTAHTHLYVAPSDPAPTNPVPTAVPNSPYVVDPVLTGTTIPQVNQVFTDVTENKYLISDTGVSPINYGE